MRAKGGNFKYLQTFISLIRLIARLINHRILLMILFQYSTTTVSAYLTLKTRAKGWAKLERRMVSWSMKQRLQPSAEYSPTYAENVERLRQIQAKIASWANSRQIPISTDQHRTTSIEQKYNVLGNTTPLGVSNNHSVRADTKTIPNPAPAPNFVSINPINMAPQDDPMDDVDKYQIWYTQIQPIDAQRQPAQQTPLNPEIGYQMPVYPPPYNYPYYIPGHAYYSPDTWTGAPMEGYAVQISKTEGSEDYRGLQKGESTYQSSIDIMNFRHFAKK